MPPNLIDIIKAPTLDALLAYAWTCERGILLLIKGLGSALIRSEVTAAGFEVQRSRFRSCVQV